MITIESPWIAGVAAADEIRVVQAWIAERYELQIEDLLSAARPQRIALPRMIAVYYLRVLRRVPAMMIAEHFRKDHTSVPAAVIAITNRMETEPKFRREMEAVCAGLGNIRRSDTP